MERTLEEIIKDLEQRRDAAKHDRDDAYAKGTRNALAFHGGKVNAYRIALELVRELLPTHGPDTLPAQNERLRAALRRAYDAIDTFRTCPICHSRTCGECNAMWYSVEKQNRAALEQPATPDPRDAIVEAARRHVAVASERSFQELQAAVTGTTEGPPGTAGRRG